MRSRRALALSLFLLVAGNAFAQDDAAVTSAYESAAQGLKAFEDGQSAEALDQFTRAYAIVKLPSLAVYMARANVKLGHYLAAAALYAQASQLEDGLGDHEVQQRAREEALSEREALMARMPRLVVQTPGIPTQSVTLQVDGSPVPSAALAEGWQLDPGMHRVTAYSGNQKLERDSSVSEGLVQTVVFQFQKEEPTNVPIIPPKQPIYSPPAPGSRAMRSATWVSFGMGGAALVFSGTTTVWALVKKHELNESNPNWNDNYCAAGNPGSDCREYKTLRTLSILSFYTGLVGVATGTVLLLATPGKQSSHPSAARVTPWVGAGIAGVEGRF